MNKKLSLLKRFHNYDISVPSLNKADGWKQTLNTDFSVFSDRGQLFSKSPWNVNSHGKRKYEYWCDKCVSLDRTKGTLILSSSYEENHSCPVCNQEKGYFTSCIDTLKTENNDGFNQAFGYFECVCKVPDAPGMWAAFWLQCAGTGKVGSKGKDGSEIDIFESSFHQKNRTMSGCAIHYDAYSAPWYRCKDNITDVGYDLYDGKFHKYSLHWTPEYYVFFVDDKPVFITDAGGVSRVPEYLRLSVEIRDDKFGPYCQEIGKFENKAPFYTDFCVKSVKVWQNDCYIPFIRSENDYKDKRKIYNKIFLIKK